MIDGTKNINITLRRLIEEEARRETGSQRKRTKGDQKIKLEKNGKMSAWYVLVVKNSSIYIEVSSVGRTEGSSYS